MAKMTFGTWEKSGVPRWAADYGSRDHLIPGGARLDASQFFREDSVLVTAPTGAALAATTIAVNALSGPIPSGTVLDFTGAGEYARLTAAAAAGATTLTVEALDAAIEAGDTARYEGAKKKFVKSGTPVGRTIAERDAGTAYGPADAADDETYLVFFDVPDADANPDAVFYRPGSVVKENFLPGVANIAAGVLADLRANYVMQRGIK